MPLNLVFTIAPLLTSLLRIHNPIEMPSTNILPKLTCRKPSLKHLIDLLERAVLDLRKVEIHPYDGDEAGWAPDPTFTERQQYARGEELSKWKEEEEVTYHTQVPS